MHLLNFSTLYAKYYIYIQLLFDNNALDLYSRLTQLKQALKIEENICRKNNNEDKFFKFHLSMRNYDENNACNYVYMNICKPPVII